MRKILLFILFLTAATAALRAQEKGVDTQNSSIRDAGSGNNSGKQDTGAGRGVNFGKGRTPAANVIPNPFRLTARREAVLEAINAILQEQNIVIDGDTSKLSEGVIRTQSFIFAKGSVITQSELERSADTSVGYRRGWTRARHTLTIELQPIDGTALNLSVTAKIEGRADGPAGPEWITLRSSGQIERELINAIVENVTGAAPADAPKRDKP